MFLASLNFWRSGTIQENSVNEENQVKWFGQLIKISSDQISTNQAHHTGRRCHDRPWTHRRDITVGLEIMMEPSE